MIREFYIQFRRLIALALAVFLSSVPAMAGLTIVGSNGITASGADSVDFYGTDSITESGADGILAFGPNAVTASGVDSIAASVAEVINRLSDDSNVASGIV